MPERDINAVITRLGILSEDVGDLKDTLKQIATAVTRLALVEERQSQANEALGRVFKVIDKSEARALDAEGKAAARTSALENRVTTIEREMPMQKHTSGWVLSAVWAAAGLAVLLILNRLGIGL